ncbi:MAG: hypothetical protein CMJ35_06985 [Phycisphaerae bacterium]|nr:hypothetical protein [Phycisphaerae bacterium]MBM91345.1 hypothetical protein [Phycisphaerae bacterium]HCT46570.1 hypothetical protein [Phycisphaerales bacterium]
MSTAQIKITTDRECDHCGYNLKGLPIEGKCPECGAPIRRLSLRTSGTMTDEAPTRFVRKLRMGFAFASAAIVGSLFVEIFSLYPLLNIPLSCLWVAGIFIITSKRPGKGHIRPDKVLDNDRLRLIVRLANLTWPARTLITAAIFALQSNPAGGSISAINALAVLGTIVQIASWVCMIPTSIYLAELAYWASHDNLAHRMRGAAWILAVIGTLVAVMTGLSIVFTSPLILVLTFLPAMIVLVTILVYNFTFIQMTLVMHHVIYHQHLVATSFERKEARRKKEEQYKGRIVDDTPCDRCGYNLIGLEPGSPCPECGTLVSHPTVPAIRDPAKTPSYHDNSDLEVEQGENKGVFFNDQLDAYGKPKSTGVAYTPAIEVPDDGEIPLAMGDEDEAETPKPESTDDSRDIDGIEPISFA